MELYISNVTLYRMSLPDHDCPWGLKAIALLNERQIPFEEHLLTSRSAVESFKDEHKVSTTPQIFAGKRRIGGYGELAKWLGEKPERADYSYQPVCCFRHHSLDGPLIAGGHYPRVYGFLYLCFSDAQTDGC